MNPFGLASLLTAISSLGLGIFFLLKGSHPAKISVISYPLADKIIIRVGGLGPGIKKENLEHLFEPYFTTKGAKGTGMGLFLSRQFVRAQGGSLDIESQEAQGTLCTITLVIPPGRDVNHVL
jgi:signal transduction histidine kinase